MKFFCHINSPVDKARLASWIQVHLFHPETCYLSWRMSQVSCTTPFRSASPLLVATCWWVLTCQRYCPYIRRREEERRDRWKCYWTHSVVCELFWDTYKTRKEVHFEANVLSHIRTATCKSWSTTHEQACVDCAGQLYGNFWALASKLRQLLPQTKSNSVFDNKCKKCCIECKQRCQPLEIANLEIFSSASPPPSPPNLTRVLRGNSCTDSVPRHPIRKIRDETSKADVFGSKKHSFTLCFIFPCDMRREEAIAEEKCTFERFLFFFHFGRTAAILF